METRRNKSRDNVRTYGIYIFLCIQVVFYCIYISRTSCSLAHSNVHEGKTQSLNVRNETTPLHILAKDFSSNPQETPSPILVNNTENVTDDNTTHQQRLPSGYGPVQDVWHNLNSSTFAYVFYVTDENYACSALVNAYRLRHEVNMDQTIDIVFLVLSTKSFSSTFYHSVKSLSIRLKVVDGLDIMQGSNSYYADCMVKLRVFELEEYKRIVFFDSDIMIIKNMDHLFYLPSTLIAAPRAWWISQPFFTSILLVLEPSKKVFEKRILNHYRKDQEEQLSDLYDMDLLNKEFKNEVMYLPGYYAALDALYGQVEKWKGFEGENGPRFKREYTQEEAIPLMHFLHMSGNGKYWNIHSKTKLNHSLPLFKQTYQMWWRIHDTICGNMLNY